MVWIGSNDLWATNNDDESEAVNNFKANIDTILKQLTEKGIVVFIAFWMTNRTTCAFDPQFDPGTGP